MGEIQGREIKKYIKNLEAKKRYSWNGYFSICLMKKHLICLIY